MEKNKLTANTTNLVGMLVGLVLLIVGGVLVGITKFASVSSNPYESTIATVGVLYALLLAVGFVIFVTFLSIIYES